MTEAAGCPACGEAEGLLVWRARDVPVRSCTAVGARREAALAFPRGEIRLVCCLGCGLLHNEAYDEALLASAGDGPGDTQAFVADHAHRTRALAADLVERWDVRRRLIVDIGCGDALFLAALCQAGENFGVGIDPAAPLAPPDPRVALVRELYSEHHVGLPADLVCSRFLLEHGADPRAFLTRMTRQMRHRVSAGWPASLALLEVPDGRSTLDRAVPWEVYYEHCSYFSAGSLARLARRVGLDVLDVTTVGRHLVLMAGAGASPRAARLGLVEDDLPAVCAAAESFAPLARRRLDRWRGELEARAPGTVVLWGAGARTATFLAGVGRGAAEAVACVVDVDPAKRGTLLAGTGHEVIAPAELAARNPTTVVVMNDLYVDEVRRDLARRDVAVRVMAA